MKESSAKVNVRELFNKHASYFGTDKLKLTLKYFSEAVLESKDMFYGDAMLSDVLHYSASFLAIAKQELKTGKINLGAREKLAMLYSQSRILGQLLDGFRQVNWQYSNLREKWREGEFEREARKKYEELEPLYTLTPFNLRGDQVSIEDMLEESVRGDTFLNAYLLQILEKYYMICFFDGEVAAKQFLHQKVFPVLFGKEVVSEFMKPPFPADGVAR